MLALLSFLYLRRLRRENPSLFDGALAAAEIEAIGEEMPAPCCALPGPRWTAR